MTDTTETQTTEPAETEQAEPIAATAAETDVEATDVEPDAPADTDAASKLRAEAGKWRKQFREAETTIENLRKSLIEHEVRAAGYQPAGLWASGATVTDMLDDSGNVDPEAVRARVSDAAATLGLRSNRFQGDGDMGRGKRSQPTPSAPSWTDLTRRKN